MFVMCMLHQFVAAGELQTRAPAAVYRVLHRAEIGNWVLKEKNIARRLSGHRTPVRAHPSGLTDDQ